MTPTEPPKSHYKNRSKYFKDDVPVSCPYELSVTRSDTPTMKHGEHGNKPSIAVSDVDYVSPSKGSPFSSHIALTESKFKQAYLVPPLST